MDELAVLPEDVRKLALDRLRLLQPHLEQNQSLQAVAQAAGIPYRTAQRWVVRLAPDLGEETLSYGTAFNIVRGLPVDLLTLAHDGTKAYSETFELIHRREADGPNAIWQAGHTPLDILLIRPDGEIANPWLTVVIDDYSRVVAGRIWLRRLSQNPPFGRHRRGHAGGGSFR